MPSLSFVLPHWLYWGILLLFPLLAMFLVARQRRRGAPREPLLFNAYLFWLTSGFMHWFLKRGFVQVDADWLPEARKRKYNWDRRSQVFVKKLG